MESWYALIGLRWPSFLAHCFFHHVLALGCTDRIQAAQSNFFFLSLTSETRRLHTVLHSDPCFHTKCLRFGRRPRLAPQMALMTDQSVSIISSYISLFIETNAMRLISLTGIKGQLPDHLAPKKPGHQYSNNCILGSKVDQHLRQMLRGIKPEIIDYDLAVGYFIFETSHLSLPDIPQSVDIILQDYQQLRPLTSRQNDLLTCAKHIKSIIEFHIAKPGSMIPFALRYAIPTSTRSVASPSRGQKPHALLHPIDLMYW